MDIPQHPARDQVPQVLVNRVEDRLRARFYQRLDPGPTDGVHYGLGVFHRGGHWLLQQEVPARLGGGNGETSEPLGLSR